MNANDPLSTELRVAIPELRESWVSATKGIARVQAWCTFIRLNGSYFPDYPFYYWNEIAKILGRQDAYHPGVLETLSDEDRTRLQQHNVECFAKALNAIPRFNIRISLIVGNLSFLPQNIRSRIDPSTIRFINSGGEGIIIKADRVGIGREAVAIKLFHKKFSVGYSSNPSPRGHQKINDLPFGSPSGLLQRLGDLIPSEVMVLQKCAAMTGVNQLLGWDVIWDPDDQTKQTVVEVLSFAKGHTMEDISHANLLNPAQCIQASWKLLDVVFRLHTIKRIKHRDIVPKNVVINIMEDSTVEVVVR
ncbi:hypothetical protein M427DRAFT_239191 [Gonapodya prolifera JEL478]|uniref:Protein kinase domain-containing protein n=1 Tax=Gonapodya prolifera (strain JEL478) TaxID=1344416 RepID=A0A138ZXW4_GONPJ|nr:hypothetical protein M427DRAFT_239191 [Gonapodya prolifera JEL478]|eukprot:KXS09281.1 hypothetical protein M427DRAFT_239191 [Gonapodya prolifera JEL478]